MFKSWSQTANEIKVKVIAGKSADFQVFDTHLKVYSENQHCHLLFFDKVRSESHTITSTKGVATVCIEKETEAIWDELEAPNKKRMWAKAVENEKPKKTSFTKDDLDYQDSLFTKFAMKLDEKMEKIHEKDLQIEFDCGSDSDDEIKEINRKINKILNPEKFSPIRQRFILQDSNNK
eukprot:NODE_9_length_64580_cov_1.431941.p42 type:complete len:177 gc:universal NODE_9_length_64580_cov_1.431941:17482-18012(+)